MIWFTTMRNSGRMRSRSAGGTVRYTATGAQATAQSKLALFEDPLVCANRTRRDFRGEDLIAVGRPVAVRKSVPSGRPQRLPTDNRFNGPAASANIHGFRSSKRALSTLSTGRGQ